MKHLEIEFKYRADNISLAEFAKFCKGRYPKSYKEVSGYDYFFENPLYPDSIMRRRVSLDMDELTYKEKTSEKNNYIRKEFNIGVSYGPLQPFLENLGWSFNFQLFKTCFIYKYDWYTAVYYICYDTEMKELGRFVELEMSEDKQWQDGEAENELAVLEKLCKSLGISPQARVKKSLFELFRKDPV